MAYGIALGYPNLCNPGSASTPISTANLNTLMASIKAAGFTKVRFDYNGTGGSTTAAYVAAAEGAGLTVNLIVGIAGQSNASYTTACTTAVNYYKPGGTGGFHIVEYELGNETNDPAVFSTGAAYQAVAKGGGAAIKAVLPGTSSILTTAGCKPGGVGGALYGPTYIDSMLNACAGVYTWFDRVATHPYGFFRNATGAACQAAVAGWPQMADNTTGGSTAQKSNIEGVLTAYGLAGTVKISATEWGAPSWSDGVISTDWTAAGDGSGQGMTEAECANMYSIGIADWKTRSWTGDLYVFSARDRIPQTGFVGNREGHFGSLERTDLSHKPSYSIIQNAITTGGGGGGGGGGAAFPTTGILDSFTRADGAIGAPWSGHPTGDYAADLAVLSNKAGGAPGGDLFQDATHGPDCEAYVTIASPGNDLDYRIFARMTAANGNGYCANVYVGNPVGTNPLIRLYRVTGGVRTLIASTSSAWASGDSLGLQIVGSNIAAWRKPSAGAWASVLSVTDSTYSATGFVGLGADNVGSCDDFGGGLYVPSAATAVTGRLLTGIGA